MMYKGKSLSRLADMIAGRITDRLVKLLAERVVEALTPLIQSVVEMSRQQVDLEARVDDLEYLLGYDDALPQDEPQEKMFD